MADPLREHLRSVTARARGRAPAALPHLPRVRSGRATAGYHLQVRRDGDEMVAEHVFEDRHSGAPGIAQGGAVATVVDDVLGFLLYVAMRRA